MKSVRGFNLLLFTLIGGLDPLAAQEKTFEREYTYKASDLDSKISSRAIVVNQLRSTLLNEIGVYVESEQILKTSDVSGKFSQDFVENIATISAGITNLKILDEKWNGETFWMRASITVDKTNLEESLKQLIADRQKLKELEETKQRLNRATKQLDSLKNIVDRNTLTNQKNQSDRYNDEVGTLSATDYYYTSESKFKLKDYDGALSDLSKALEIKPNFAQAYNARGMIHSVLNDNKSAIIDYTKAIELNDKDEDSYNSRGVAKFELKDYDGAIGDYNKTIEINALSAYAYYNRGNSKAALKEYESALADYSKAIEIDPKNPVNYLTYNGIGIVKHDLKDYTGAIANFTVSIKINPNYKKSFDNRGISKAASHDFKGSLLDFNKAIEIDPNFGTAYIHRGFSKGQLNDLKGSQLDFNKAIEINPNDSDAYLGRGLGKLMFKQNTSACQDFEKAAELGNVHAPEAIKEYCK